MRKIDKKFASPKSLNNRTKPSLFCPGCGHSITLKHLANIIDQLEIQSKTTFCIDIGCSLLAWNYLAVDTVQCHHGRSTSVATGVKKAAPRRAVICYMGDGGGYAIGLQSILHSAFRNEPITAILINNTDYSMTGGQMAPTTIDKEITSTSPLGKDVSIFGQPFHGPELVRQIANQKAYVARTSVSNPIHLETTIKKAIENQIKNKSFSFVEVLSICPVNWKTNTEETFSFLSKMEKIYQVGEITRNDK